ncbi:MAG: serine/threonine phosphatase [Xenococcus sp. MO_188.B8]|nr:serine/threonine phosphatase [Xenococcus sp. MO_188.B8]
MLICPECKSENPEHNKFCEKCGTSLTHTDCHQCGAQIAFTEHKCNTCGAYNKTMLLALIIQNKPSQVPQPQEKELASISVSETASSETSSSSPSESISSETLSSSAETEEDLDTTNQVLLTQNYVGYLDAQKRYYAPENKASLSNVVDSQINPILLQVIDHFPLQESSLSVLRKTQTELFTELEQKLDDSNWTDIQYSDLGGIPPHALPYLALEEYAPTIPLIYDAWQNQEQGILLLPDLSTWQSLTNLWSQPQLPLLQVLSSLGAMAKLWIPLSKNYCATSLLIQSNLKVDEDQSFCLERLYLDPEDKRPTLSDLVAKWYSWLTDSEQTYPESLISVLKQTISGEIKAIEDLLAQLHQIAELEEINLDSSSMDTDSWSDAIDAEPWETSDDSEETDFFTLDSNEDSMIYESDADEQPTAMLSMQIASFAHANYTDIGSSRDHNEDFFGIQTFTTQEENPSRQTLKARGLYIICDGMGGHAAGEVASAMAVETLQTYFHTYWQDEFPSEKTIEEGILLANQVIYQTNIDNARSGSGRMGTTLVMALLQNTQLAIAHVGDSRIYRITRQGGLEQLTVDHEVGQREINRGVEPAIAYGRPDAYQLTQALGPRENKHLRPSIQYLDIEKDCLILLCSDGLSDNDLIEKHWQTYLEPLISSSADLNSGLCDLMKFADRYNGHDNLTSILIRIKLKPDL